MINEFLSIARENRLNDLPNFSGHMSENVNRFLKTIKLITRANDQSNDDELWRTIRSKLIQSAAIWFDNNKSNFQTWSHFENAFRNEYCSTIAMSYKFNILIHRKQLQDESVLSYFDDVIALCDEIDSNMSNMMIILYLINGIHPRFKRELLRRSSLIQTPDDFFKYAKIEEDLYQH